MPRADVLLVSLAGTHGLREADAELAAALERAGASVATVTAARPREWRTFALIELAWARNARRAAAAGIAAHGPRAVLYSTTTASLLAPAPGAIRFDAPAAGNRPGPKFPSDKSVADPFHPPAPPARADPPRRGRRCRRSR